jgi:lathosterol oxidase
MITGHIFEKAINGPAHHTLHHLYFTVNYGQVSFILSHHLLMDKSDHPLSLQYFTWADRFGGSYRQPESHLDPLLEVKALDNKKD